MVKALWALFLSYGRWLLLAENSFKVYFVNMIFNLIGFANC